MGSNSQRGGESSHLSSQQPSKTITVNKLPFLIESLLQNKKKTKRKENTSLNIYIIFDIIFIYI